MKTADVGFGLGFAQFINLPGAPILTLNEALRLFHAEGFWDHIGATDISAFDYFCRNLDLTPVKAKTIREAKLLELNRLS